MAGISSTLSIAKGAIIAQQYGLNITGHNIANVNNPDYSRQDAAQTSNTPALYGGHLFGTGVKVEQVQQQVDKLLENRLVDAKSNQAAFKEAESYMNVIESFFDENSDTSINNTMTDFWNSWHDLSDNPLGSSERVAVYEKANLLAKRFNTADEDFSNVTADINKEIDSTITRINSLTKQIGEVNRQIITLESNKTANDQRDQRNALVKELGDLIDVDTFEQSNGAMIVNTANGKPLVNGVYSYDLSLKDKDIMWQGSYGSRINISDDIKGGKLGGWLEIRDEVIPKYRSEVNELSREMIWAMNYQHSKGAGLDYFSDPMTGDYSTDDSGLLSSFKFGDKIDYTKNFSMWTKDTTTSDAKYNKTNIDMGISDAKISKWSGTVPGGVQSRYKLTVMDGAIIGNNEVAETDGDGLAKVWGSTSDVSTALNGAIQDQTLTVYDSPSGTAKIDIKDSGGDAKRSAASIAKALSGVDGVTAYASANSADFDISQLKDGVNAGNGVQEGDTIKFSLYVDGLMQNQSFVVDYSNRGSLTKDESLEEQFENSILEAVKNVNNINSDKDLAADGLKITSSSGKTLGVQNFEVQDNAGININTFSNFNSGDDVSFTVDSSGFGSSSATSTSVSVDLTDVDTSKQEEVSKAFYDALKSALADKPFTVANDPSTNSIVLRTNDGSDITIKDGANDTGSDATFTMTALGGTASNAGNVNDQLSFDGSGDTATYNAATVSTDSIVLSGNGTGVTINESSAGAVNKAGVITGTVTAVMNKGMSIYSSVSGANSGGLFTNSNHAIVGSSIMTFGGDGGYSGFSDKIEFDVDGIHVSYDVAAGPPVPTNPASPTELENAKGLEASLTAALVTPFTDPDYSIIRTGKSVSIIKNKDLDDPIEITNFVENVSAAAVSAGTSNPGNASLQVKTGTGSGINEPENDLLESGSTYRDFSTSSLYSDKGIIKWEKLDKDGLLTGDSGLINVEDKGKITINESGVPSLSFNLSDGALVAGNTLIVNTDTNGKPDPLNFRITGKGNSKSDIYHFKVVSGGKVGHVPEVGKDPLTIEWESSSGSGTFEIQGNDPPYTPAAPVDVKVDGMTLKFYDGTVFKDDVFTVTTDDGGVPVSLNESGKPSGERLSDWHWTLDSFADQFNRDVGGMKASVNSDNQLTFQSSDTFHSIENVSYSGANGFAAANTSIKVKNWSGLDFNATDLKFVRSASSGTWGIENDPTGGLATILPAGGDDDGFGVDFTGDGLADIKIGFAKRVSGDGYVKFDLVKHDSNDMHFAFSDDASSASGLVAAAGINTFFKGYDSMTMQMNEKLNDTKFIAAAQIDNQTGHITQGDNANALAMADVQFMNFDMKQWSYSRGSDTESSLTSANFDDYYRSMIGSMGIKSRSIKNSKSFSDTMVDKMTEQRDAVSAVSLDEEMINLMKFQNAFAAASKLIKVSDEMLNTLISVR